MDHPRQPFRDFLAEHRDGRTHEELSQVLHELVTAVLTHGERGRITLTLVVAPHEFHSNAVEITDSIRAKIPEAPRYTLFFTTPATGDLTRVNPLQAEMTLDGPSDEQRREIGISPSPHAALA